MRKWKEDSKNVMPRKRHVSRNDKWATEKCSCEVMPRKRHVSRNTEEMNPEEETKRHASQEACE